MEAPRSEIVDRDSVIVGTQTKMKTGAVDFSRLLIP
jgi:hypothetical protein